MNLEEVLDAYDAKFGGKPHILFLDDDEAIALMQVAIDTGIPIPEPDIPEGALI
jgi:hypothetical protein